MRTKKVKAAYLSGQRRSRQAALRRIESFPRFFLRNTLAPVSLLFSANYAATAKHYRVVPVVAMFYMYIHVSDVTCVY